MTQTIIHPTIFRRDSTGRLRTWHAERIDDTYRTTSGLPGRKSISSGWIQCKGKQGRDGAAQALFEVESAYRYHLARDYHLGADAAGTPRFFKPMLAGKYELFHPGYAQPKLDGIRCIATAQGLFTREGRPIYGAPHIAEELASLLAAQPDLVLDGELYNHRLRDDFNEIVRLVRRRELDDAHRARSAAMIEFHVYDLPSVAEPFATRQSQLLSLVGDLATIVIVETEKVDDDDSYDACHARWMAAGYEGSMWRADAAYEQKRSKHLLKRKPIQDAEFACVAIEEGRGHWQGTAKTVLCRLPDGRTFSAGVKGNRDFARALLGETHRLVTVEFLHLTPDGIPRFPVATKFWGARRDA